MEGRCHNRNSSFLKGALLLCRILGGNRIKDLDWSVLRDLHSLKYL